MSDHQELIEWTPESAATAFCTSASTLRRRLKKAGIDPNEGFSTQNVLKAFAAEDDRIREVKARIEHWQLKSRKLRQLFKPTRAQRVGIAAFVKAQINIIEASELSKRDKEDIIEAISSLNKVVDATLANQTPILKALKKDNVDEEE
jgi:hypothetical protein